MINVLKNKNEIPNKIFYRGVVEDRNHPKQLNKCRVRIPFIHPPKELVPTNHLPWAELMGGTMFGGTNSGFGVSSVPQIGTIVWVFFENNDWNKPVIFGTVYANLKDSSLKSENSEYPIENESGVNDLSLGKVNEKKKENKEEGIPTGNGDTWDENETKVSEYPNSNVLKSFSGNILEFDDTKDNSRINLFHNSGSYLEFQNNADIVTKSKNSNYIIIENNNNCLIKNSNFYTIQGNEQYKIDGNSDVFIGGNKTEIINSNSDLKISGSKTENVSGSCKEVFSGGQNVDAGGSMVLKAGVIRLN